MVHLLLMRLDPKRFVRLSFLFQLMWSLLLLSYSYIYIYARYAICRAWVNVYYIQTHRWPCTGQPMRNCLDVELIKEGGGNNFPFWQQVWIKLIHAHFYGVAIFLFVIYFKTYASQLNLGSIEVSLDEFRCMTMRGLRGESQQVKEERTHTLAGRIYLEIQWHKTPLAGMDRLCNFHSSSFRNTHFGFATGSVPEKVNGRTFLRTIIDPSDIWRNWSVKK